MSKNIDGSMTVVEHLAELRLRLVVSVLTLLAAAVFSFTRAGQIRHLLTSPAGGLELIYLSPPEALTANLRLAVVAGVVLASPLIMYQVMAFLFPAFYDREKPFVLAVLIGAGLLFGSGVFFAYRVAFPFMIKFFLQFASTGLEPRFTISEYISFVFSFHLGFGLCFLLPLLAWILGRGGVLSSAFLRRSRKFALLVILVMAAIITPPDLISQTVMVGPLLFLYELGIFMVILGERKRRKEWREAGLHA